MGGRTRGSSSLSVPSLLICTVRQCSLSCWFLRPQGLSSMASGTDSHMGVKDGGLLPLPPEEPSVHLMRHSWYHTHLLQNSPEATAFPQYLEQTLYTNIWNTSILALWENGNPEASYLRHLNMGSHAARDPQSRALVSPGYCQDSEFLWKIFPQVNSRANFLCFGLEYSFRV